MAWDRDPRAGDRQVIPSLGTVAIAQIFMGNWLAHLFAGVRLMLP